LQYLFIDFIDFRPGTCRDLPGFGQIPEKQNQTNGFYLFYLPGLGPARTSPGLGCCQIK
jgi:hypothetical protein